MNVERVARAERSAVRTPARERAARYAAIRIEARHCTRGDLDEVQPIVVPDRTLGECEFLCNQLTLHAVRIASNVNFINRYSVAR